MEDMLAHPGGCHRHAGRRTPTLVLTLTRENIDSQVLTVDASGKASEYLLRYEISYSVLERRW